MGGRPLKAVLLDTNAWVWSFSQTRLLSKKANEAINSAAEVFVTPVSFFEVAQKARLGKWPEMAATLRTLADVIDAQGSKILNLDAKIGLLAGRLDWDHRDPFDRMILATALHHGLPLVSSDAVFDGHVVRIW